jgi:hypothetical protein
VKITRQQAQPLVLRRFLPDLPGLVFDFDDPFSATIAIFGPPGRNGDGSAVSWSPPSAQTTWMIPHNLGFNPLVQVFDSAGDVVFTNVTHLDINTCLIEFSQPVSGTAELR